MCFYACNTATKPSNIMPEQILTHVLYDIHLHDAIIHTENSENNKPTIYLSKEHYDSAIFNKYNITDTIFKLSIEHYTLNGEIKKIYAHVIDSLNAIKVQYEKVFEKLEVIEEPLAED